MNEIPRKIPLWLSDYTTNQTAPSVSIQILNLKARISVIQYYLRAFQQQACNLSAFFHS